MYKGKNVKEQRGKGINAQGEKKLITDYAFFEDIIVKMHFIKEVQDDFDRVTGYKDKTQMQPDQSELTTNDPNVTGRNSESKQ